MLKLARLRQSAKAYAPICLTDSGIVTLTKEPQAAKAWRPMDSTESGMKTDTKELQFWKPPASQEKGAPRAYLVVVSSLAPGLFWRNYSVLE